MLAGRVWSGEAFEFRVCEAGTAHLTARDLAVVVGLRGV